MNILQKMSPSEYHARKEISASMLKKCDPPARLKWAMDHPEESTDEMRLGTAVHSLVFNGTHDFPVKPEGMKFSTTEGKKWQAENADKLKNLITSEQNDRAYKCRDALRTNPETRRILFDEAGETDLACIVHDPELGVDCRCLYDWVPTFCDPIDDIKTVAGGKGGLREFTKEIINRGYHIQAGWYLRLWNLYHDDPHEKRFRFRFIVVETEAPFLTAVYELSHEFIQAGEREAVRRAEMVRDCMATGIWPGLDQNQTIEKPKWINSVEAVEEFQW